MKTLTVLGADKQERITVTTSVVRIEPRLRSVSSLLARGVVVRLDILDIIGQLTPTQILVVPYQVRGAVEVTYTGSCPTRVYNVMFVIIVMDPKNLRKTVTTCAAI
ncbi:hypothetical protein DGG96_18955 [Legionella qingyii]|uniref:Uncharacterized protein n=1 Tax=Legionella qingyii TaxID=2184757 RepID=A0A317U125_9GAMM|nr:hypothetical protein DGG96_18955 [Legionella qingyii]